MCSIQFQSLEISCYAVKMTKYSKMPIVPIID